MAEREATCSRGLARVLADGSAASVLDQVAVEEPLEIRIAGDRVAVTMRTPGHDRELALGFLLSEGVIRSAADVGSLAHCGRPGDAGYGNVLDVRPAPGIALAGKELGELRRGTVTTSACGVCGRQTIDDLIARCPRSDGARPAPTLDLLRQSAARLRGHQPNFDRSGGLHAAAVFDPAGTLLASAEDVGRHNAVDKVLGRLLLQAAAAHGEALHPTLAPCVLAVSGRISFEIVQKACMGGLSAVCGISAPTSLAIDLAERSGIALAGFVREQSLNLYSQAQRVLQP